MIKPFAEQTTSPDYRAIVVREFLKFQGKDRQLEVELAYRSGYWNVFKYTKELHEFLDTNQIAYRLVLKEEVFG